uniref:Uncharacterized protein n=1 Tax=Chromera velia CCMP2878 TaxID=1169474 RepID=A0A0G4HG14_9ALVE|eukprot:Cvel_27083.t1-p1 / transcript=Cvel_27083.t1 / gene=Cvel_27083 / organism=Chromera_velia_CCMP2878 / gene_product=hypothetical protein / transcript_product=hypothetical protein / location=Cvel_scaffold3317:12781-13512(+) / protein_length=244 / sequence_SO=supercontig / SO=protein_coding / is_pseudo=false
MLLNRIAWVAAGGEKTLRFLDFVQKHRVVKDDVAKWLNKCEHCVLLADELNRLLTEQTVDGQVCQTALDRSPCVQFLNNHFLTPKGRGLVFSSRTFSTTLFLEYILFRQGVGRPVRVRSLPLVETMDEARKLGKDAERATLAWLGRSPGLVFCHYDPRSQRKVGSAKKRFEKVNARIEAGTLPHLVHAELTGSGYRLPEEWREFVDVRFNIDQSIDPLHIWPPCYLSEALDAAACHEHWHGKPE